MSHYKLAVWVSGSGTLLKQMIDDGHDISLVLADRDCPGLQFAREANIEVLVLDRRAFGWSQLLKNWRDSPQKGRFSRQRREYSAAIARLMRKRGISLVAMAGFMTVLAPEFFQIYDGLILNIHPALLPAFKGGTAVSDALAFGVKWTGTTVHIATSELDYGPILAQAPVPVLATDTVDSLRKRIKKAERPLYSETIGDLMSGRLKLAA